MDISKVLWSVLFFLLFIGVLHLPSLWQSLFLFWVIPIYNWWLTFRLIFYDLLGSVSHGLRICLQGVGCFVLLIRLGFLHFSTLATARYSPCLFGYITIGMARHNRTHVNQSEHLLVKPNRPCTDLCAEPCSRGVEQTKGAFTLARAGVRVCTASPALRVRTECSHMNKEWVFTLARVDVRAWMRRKTRRVSCSNFPHPEAIPWLVHNVIEVRKVSFQ